MRRLVALAVVLVGLLFALPPRMQADAVQSLLYVLNDSTTGNKIYAFWVNETTGALTPVAGFPFVTGETGSGNYVSERIAIDTPHQRLYVLNDGNERLSAYSINAQTGALTAMPFSPISLGAGSWTTVAVHPTGSPLLVGDGDTSPVVASYVVTSTTATPAQGSPFATGGVGPYSSAFSSSGAYYYTGGNTGTAFAGFSVAQTTGLLTALAGSPFSAGGYPGAYVTDSQGRVFLANIVAGTLRAFTTSAGVPTPTTTATFASGLTSTVDGLLSPGGGFYYVADRSGNRVGSYQIGGTGASTTLTAIQGSPFASGGSLTCALASNYLGNVLFAANCDTRNITTFAVDGQTGVLSIPVTQATNTLGTAGRITGMAYLPFLADLQVTKSGPASVAGGNSVEYSITLANAGPAPAQSVTLTDVVPTGTSLTSTVVTPATWSSSLVSRTLTFSKAAVAAGEIATFKVRVSTSADTPATVTNTATVASSTSDPATANNTASATTTVETPDLAVTLGASPTSVVPGNNITYTITVGNVGNGTANTVTLSDALSPGTTFVSASAPGWALATPAVGATGTITGTLPSMAAGASSTVQVVAQLSPRAAQGAVVTHTASVTSSGLDRTTTNNSSTATITAAAPQADLRARWDASGLTDNPPHEVHAGSMFTSRFYVANAGPSDAASPQWSFTIPSGTTFAWLSTTAGWTCTTPAIGGTGTVSCSATTLAFGSGPFWQLSVNVTAAPGTTLGYSLAVTSPTSDAVPSNNTVSATTLVTTDGDETALTAQPLGSTPTVVRGQINPAGDVDFYSFAGSVGDRVYAATVTAANTRLQDTTLTLLGPDGTSVVEMDAYDGVFTEEASSIAGAVLPASGTYYLKVSAADGPSPYDLYVHVRSGGPIPETVAGGTLPGSHWVSGVINPAGDTDSFTFPVSAGDRVFASLDMDPDRVGGTRWSGVLTLGKDGQSFDANDANTTSPNSEANFLTMKDAGTATVTVAAASGAGTAATYHLSVSVIPAPVESCTTYTSSDVPKAVGPDPVTGGVISSLTVPAAVRVGRVSVMVNLTHTNFADLDVSLVAPDGNEVVLFHDLANGAGAFDTRFDEVIGARPATAGGALSSPFIWQMASEGRLSWFNGQLAQGTWTLKVRDDLAGNAGTLTGWGLIICPEATTTCPAGTTPLTLLATDFETGAAGFTHSGTLDEWELGTPSYAPITTCASGTTCWKTDLDERYSDNADATLVSPSVTVPDTAGAVLVTWAQKYQTEWASFDKAAVDLRQVGTAHMVRLWEQTANEWMFVSLGSESVQMSSGWARKQALATDFAGQATELRFRLSSAGGTEGAGLAIDDVDIAACMPSADLSITTTDTPDPAVAGGTVTYSVTVTNAGPSPASSVTVTNTLPANATFVSATGPAGWTLTTPAVGATGNVTASGNALAVGGSATFTIAVRAPADADALSSSAAVAATGSLDPTATNNATTVTTTVTALADLSTTLAAAPDPAVAGRSVTYSLGVANAGPSVATTVTASLPLPAGTTFVSASAPPGWALAMPAVGGAGTLTASLASLAPGASGTITLVVQTDAALPNGQLAATATFGSTTADPASANNTATATTTVTALADLWTTLAVAPDPVVAGRSMTYSLGVANAGPSVATTVTASLPLPAGTTFVSASAPPGWTLATPAVGGAGTLTASLASLAPGASGSVALVVQTDPALASGPLATTATVASATPDPTAVNDTASAAIALTRLADLGVTLAATPGPIVGGQTVTYAIGVSNAGPSAAFSVQLTLPLPAGSTFVSAVAPTGWTLTAPAVGTAGTLAGTRAVMAAGELAGFTVVVQVPPGAPQRTLGAVATVASVTTDPDSSNNVASAATAATPQPPTVTITSPTTAATCTATESFVTVAGTADAATGPPLITWASNRGPSGAATGTTAWTAAGIPLYAGANVITVTATDSGTPSATSTATLTVDVQQLSYYLAEGSTGTFWDLDIAIANPNTVEAPITIRFLKDDATTEVVSQTLPPLSRTTVRVDDIANMAQTATSTVVTSTAGLPLVVERSMFWDHRYYASHGGTAVSGPSTRWLFGEGSQGFFDTYVLLANANDAAATATVRFLTESGAVVTRDIPLPPTSRVNVATSAIPELFNQSFSIVVEATLPIIAERAMYFGTTGDRLWVGGHESVGVTEGATTWFLAEGATGLFDNYVLVGNPNDAPATVTLTYLLTTGQVVERHKTMTANSRMTVNTAAEAPELVQAEFSTRVTADVPVIAERAMYWPAPFPNWTEAHNAFGVTTTALKWGLAEGRIGGEHAFETYILLANPNTADAQVQITYLRTNGAPIVKAYPVTRESRLTISVNANVPELSGETFAAVIEVLNGQPIAVERAMYNNDNTGTWWAAGTNATAVRLP